MVMVLMVGVDDSLELRNQSTSGVNAIEFRKH